MKTLSFLLCIFILIQAPFAQKAAIQKTITDQAHENNKKVDITLVINGSTVRITGQVRINLLTSTLVFEGSITVSGSGGSFELPVNYNGPLQKGSNNHYYNEQLVAQDDRLITEWAVSRIYFLKNGEARFDASKDIRTLSTTDKK